MNTATATPITIDKSLLLKVTWTRAYEAALSAGTSVREHLSAAMRSAWADWRECIAEGELRCTLTREYDDRYGRTDRAMMRRRLAAAKAAAAEQAEVEQEPVTEQVPEIDLSYSYKLGRLDKRCRGWERVIRESVSLPAPEDVNGAGDLPGAYAPDRGEEELFGLDAVMQGEENHHRRSRGWTYWLHVRNPATGELVTMKPTAERKAAIKAAIRHGRIDLPVEILKGAGDIAGMVRMLAAIRAGLPVGELLAAE
ncbi:hypothetical protein MMSR116_15795 [Methylobacterium mesophilicum SR1.6/6]|uniref:Uncharacterized protein n=1 Tax=Methylobacterium mesophilicum SR1.6/6 TaxID=908290 RepID=A0A6B9FKW8_9HYPH|nr:hypothetical protein [Methylobacterium mesophilicum]QGY03183.1 hypothetical protein MMSR116_15795 [Methylobacterium mesophilicum SR1.6/6]